MHHHRARPGFKPWRPPSGDAEGKASLDQGPDQEEAAGAGLGDNNDVEEDELDALTRQYEAEAAAQAKQVLARTAKAKRKQLGTAEAREQALDTPIASDSIGFKMLEKMGYQPGQGIGKSIIGRAEPLRPEVRDKRTGLGVLEEKKRRRREELEQGKAARAKQALMQENMQAQFQDSSRDAWQRRKLLAQLAQAWKVCEQLESAAFAASLSGAATAAASDSHADTDAYAAGVKGPSSRECDADQLQHQLGKRGLAAAGSLPAKLGATQPAPPTMRSLLLLERLPALWVPSEDSEVAAAADSEAEDEEGGTADQLPLEAQLELLLQFLRQEHWYCLHCGFAYQSESDLLANCPGPSEEDH